MARLDPNAYPLSDLDFSAPFGESAHDREFHALMDASDNLPEGELKGTILSYPRGDGAAYYIVTKLRPFTVQWIPWSDAWQVEPALIRGLTLDDVREQAHRRAAMRRLFGKSKHELRS